MFDKFIEFSHFAFNFNIIIAIKLVVIPIIFKNRSVYDRNTYKHSVKKNYLKKKYKKFINRFRERHNEVDPSFSDNCPIWFLWWQGEENMPAIINTCYQTLRYYSNGHTVNLVTKDNYDKFIDMPDHILDKVNKKHISITHFSDILRMCLLFSYGGFWLDATILLTKPLPPLPKICSHLGFWSPRDNLNIIETCYGSKNWVIREDKWISGLLYMNKNNILAEFVREMFLVYLKKTSFFMDYFLVDYFISIAHDTISDVRVMIDSVPINNPNIHEIQLRLNLNYEYNKILFDDVCKDTFFHVLTWKKKFNEFTKSNKLTNYGYIINNFPPKL